MSITVSVLRVEHVQVTPENELSIIQAEFDRRYEDRDLCEGDHVEFIREGRQRHIEDFGADHIGKKGIVTALSDNRKDVKILSIAADGNFVEHWTPEICLARVQ